MGCSFDERGHCIPKLPSLGPISKLRSPKTYAESFSASQFLVITVVDSGIGISAGKQSHIFDGLVQFKPGVIQQNGQGAGLGLFIAKYIVEQHDGTLTVCSTGIEGEGSNFTVRLPGLTVLPADDNMENGNPSADNDGRGALPQLSMLDLPTVDRPFISAAEYPDIQINDGDDDDPLSVTIPVNKVLNILMVDDSTMTRKMVCKLLHFSRLCRCDEAADGSIAVEMMRRSLQTAEDLNPNDQSGDNDVLRIGNRQLTKSLLQENTQILY
eukprot:gene23656-30677_t